MVNFLIGVAIGVILSVLFIADTVYDMAAIQATKGEYVCQYNEFADDWDCKYKKLIEDKQ